MSGNPNLTLSSRTKYPQIKTPSKLMDELECHQKLCTEYRNSFFDVINLFGPAISGIIANRHRQRDMRLAVEAEKAIDAHTANRGPGESETYARLNTMLELQAILHTEYRDSYFAAVNLIGAGVFAFARDYHRQHDGVVEAEAARVDSMIENIWRAAD